VPSVLSHPAVALGVSRWFVLPRAAIVAGAVISILPDADAIGFWLGVPYGAPLGHRGFTHSLVFAAVLAAAGLAGLRWSSGAPLRGAFASYLFLCAASHGVLDGMTDGGLGVAYFAPFSDTRFFLPWRPLPVSPISVSGFISGRGLEILGGEFVWIWLPCLGLALAAAVRRRAPANPVA